jgi:hypothetical protein
MEDLPDSESEVARATKQERRHLLLERSAELPRLEGELVEESRGLLGGESEQLRWVVLNGTSLSIWDKQPLEAVDATKSGTSNSQHVELASPRLSGRKRVRSSGKEQTQTPRKVYAMDELTKVDSNPVSFRLFLRFEATYAAMLPAREKSLCLVARGEDDFKLWMEALSAYDNGLALQRYQRYQRDCGTSTLPARSRRTENSCDQKQTGVEAYDAKPNTEPLPTEPLPTLLHNRRSKTSSKSTFDVYGDEAYDLGCGEGKAIMDQRRRLCMGIMDQRRGLC